uniref:DDB1- and CUL4-associated factor 11 n=1 Tax=Cacopsylla melanoneura TaxID=428564 RepID=A0A8D8UZK1_9HEMI
MGQSYSYRTTQPRNRMSSDQAEAPNDDSGNRSIMEIREENRDRILRQVRNVQRRNTGPRYRVLNNQNNEEDNDNNDDENDTDSEFGIDTIEEGNGNVLDDRNELVNVLQFLIRSGVVHIVPQSEEDSDGDYVRPRIPNYGAKYKPNTDVLNKSEIKLMTEQSSGTLHSRTGTKRGSDLLSMITKRQCAPSGFSHSERCKLNNMYLPNKMTQQVGTYDGKVFTGTFSKAGDRFLTAAQDKTMRLYDTSTSDYTVMRKIPGLDVGWSIIDTAFSSTGNMFAYSSWSENVHVWHQNGDGETQDTLQLCPEGGRFCVFSLTFSQDSSEILGGANDGCLYVYDLDNKKCALKIKGHGDDVNTVCFADESSNILYSGGDDGLCKVWDRRTLNESSAKPVGVLAGHRDGITFIDPKGDSRHLISNSKDQTIKLWDVRMFSNKTAQRNTFRAVCEQNWDYRRDSVPKQCEYWGL